MWEDPRSLHSGGNHVEVNSERITSQSDPGMNSSRHTKQDVDTFQDCWDDSYLHVLICVFSFVCCLTRPHVKKTTARAGPAAFGGCPNPLVGSLILKLCVHGLRRQGNNTTNTSNTYTFIHTCMRSAQICGSTPSATLACHHPASRPALASISLFD